MSTLSLIVIETESGAEVRVRDSEEGGESYPDVYAALDSLLTDPEYLPKPGILRDESGNPSGRWRWLDATAEEPAPAEDGSQVTRDLIARMAARLNSGSPAPIDGVSSEPHQQLYATGTHADGYAHVGVEVRDRSGRWHLFLYSELSPEAARVINAGLVWSGSIGFTSDGRLLQHALTNVPAVEGLRPNNATRHQARRVHFRSMRITMPVSRRGIAVGDRVYVAPDAAHMPEASGEGVVREIGTAALGVEFDANPGVVHRWITAEETSAPRPSRSQRDMSKPNDAARRGPAADILAKIAAMLGISMEDEKSAESYESPIMDALYALKGEARIEGALEAASGGAPARSARVLPGFADEAEQDAFTAQILGALGDVFSQPEASPAQLLELLTASLAAFKGAIGQAAPPADAGAMSVPEDAARTAAPMVINVDTGIRANGDAHKRALDEVAKLRTEITRRDLRDAIAKRAVDAKVALPELDQLVSDALAVTDVSARERMISSAVRAAQTVPSGDVFGRSASSPVPEDFRAAWRSLVPEIEKANPGLPTQHHVALAQRTARERFPQFADA